MYVIQCHHFCLSLLQKLSFNFGVKELLKILFYFFQKHRILAKFIGTPAPHFLLLPSMLSSNKHSSNNLISNIK